MSDQPGPVLTKKQQKAAEFKAKKQKEALAARGKGKKAAAGPALDDGFVGDEDEPEPAASSSKPVKSKKDKKAKVEEDETAAVVDEPVVDAGDAAPAKRSAKARGKAPAAAQDEDGEEDAPAAVGEEKSKGGKAKQQPAKPKAKPRYILFVGNLPRTSTSPEIAAWFEQQINVRPSVRLLTSKPAPGAPSTSGPGESRGIAFIEFTESAPLNAALALHQSPYPVPGARHGQVKKLNIELTAGGGGSGANRKTKIDKRNEVLRKQAGMGGLDGEEEKKAKWAREAEEKAALKGKRKRGGKDGAADGQDKPTFGAADAKVAGWGDDREAKRPRSSDGAATGGRGGRGGGRGGAGRGRGGGRGGGAGGERRGGSAWTPGTGANFTALG